MLLKYFIKFLKEEKAYTSYRKNLMKEPDVNLVKQNFFNKKIKNENISEADSLILGAFTWSETIEGSRYWHNLYQKWCDYLKENYNL